MLATPETQLAEPPLNADQPAPRLVADAVTRVATALCGLSAEEMRAVIGRVEEIYRLRGWKDGPLNLSRHHLERLERKLAACSYAVGQRDWRVSELEVWAARGALQDARRTVEELEASADKGVFHVR